MLYATLIENGSERFRFPVPDRFLSQPDKYKAPIKGPCVALLKVGVFHACKEGQAELDELTLVLSELGLLKEATGPVARDLHK